MFHQNNHPDIEYRGGQKSIVHLMFKMMDVINWANQEKQRWVFTDSNAGSRYFNDYCDLYNIDKLDWGAINTNSWSNCKEEKQAESLVEKSLPWYLVRGIGVYSLEYYRQVRKVMASTTHKPLIKVKPVWYY